MDGRDGNDLSKYSEREYVKGLRREGKRQNQEGRRSRSGKMSSRGENRKVFQWQPTRRSKNERKKEKANSEPANIEALCKRCVNIRAAR